MNTVTMTGNVASDIRYFPPTSGKRAMVSFAIANSEFINGENRDNGYFQVISFGQLATNVHTILGKGARVHVSGRLQQRKWENEDGAPQYTVEIVAFNVSSSLEFVHRSTGQSSGEALDAAVAAPPREQPRDESGRFVAAS